MKRNLMIRLSIVAVTLLTIAVLPSRAGMCNRQTTVEVSDELIEPVDLKKSHVTTKKRTSKKRVETGEASYYADKFHGRPTASGEKYNKKAFTAAHKTLPFGTKVRVTNTANGKSVDVIINDRGPFKKGRIIDLSRVAAEKIGLLQSGVAKVTVEQL